jgi:hypothetical protein
VAWVSERKDLLSAFFFFLTLLAYTRYAEIQRLEAVGRIGKGQESKDRFQSAVRSPWSYIHFPASSCYVLALLFLALGLMSKPMLVTTPFVLLLLDYWPLRRFALNPQLSTLRLLWQLLCEKLPFLLLSLLSCLVTVVAQKGAIQPLTNISLTGRLSNALVAYVRYLDKTFWPFDLATPYPYPSHWPVTSVMLATALLAMVSAAALGFSRRYPYLVTGWFWFLGMLVPVIGLVQVGEQSMADRYTYLPLIGIFILLTWGVAQSSGPATNQAEVATDPRSMRRAFLGIAAVLVLLAGSVRTRDQLRCWQDGDSLSRHAIAVTENNWIAYFDLGSSLDAKGQVDQALTNYLEALKLQPQYPDPLNNIGCILAGRRQFSQAIPYFAAALRSSPGFVNAHDNLAHSLCELGRFNEAIPHFQTVLTANPEDKTASDSLAGAHFQVGWALAA